MFTKGHGRGALTPTASSESPDSTAIEVEDIPSLLRDVARFAEAVEKLKDVVLAEGRHQLTPLTNQLTEHEAGRVQVRETETRVQVRETETSSLCVEPITNCCPLQQWAGLRLLV